MYSPSAARIVWLRIRWPEVLTHSPVSRAWRSTQIAKTLRKASSAPSARRALTVLRRQGFTHGWYTWHMKLEGIHHITAITENAQRNVDFYAGVMGLRMVKKTVNQDNPTVYHLFFADEEGDPGADLTFFEYPGAARGRAGAGTVHRIVWRVGGPEALDFWEGRLGVLGFDTRRDGDAPPLLRPRGSRPRAPRRRRPRRAADRRPPGGPPRAGAAGLPRGARLRGGARGEHRPAGGARVRADRRGLGGARLRARRPLRLRPPAGGAPRSRARGRSTTSPGPDHGGTHGLARQGDLRPAPARPRRSTASTSSPSTSASPAGSSSRSPPRPRLHRRRAARAPPRETLAAPAFEHLRDEVEPNLRPVVNPRAEVARGAGSALEAGRRSPGPPPHAGGSSLASWASHGGPGRLWPP